MPRSRTNPKAKHETTELDRIIGMLRSAGSATAAARFEVELRKLIQREGAPVIRGSEAHFFLESLSDSTIAVIGDWNNWSRTDQLVRINRHSQFHHVAKTFPIDARFAYRYLVGEHESLLDPLNPHREQEVFGTNSVVRMPAYREELLAREPAPEVPRGKVRELEVDGHKGTGKRDYTRKVYIYLPFEARKLSKLPVLYVHDGMETITVGRFVNILDNLFYQEPHLTRCAVVFVPPKERDREYMLHPGYAEWLAHTLVPTVEARFRLRPDAEHRGTLGASLGGLLSAQLGLLYPKVFGAVAAQSPAFWVQQEKIVKLYHRMRRLPLRWYMTTGTVNDAEDGTRKMLSVLQDKGYSVTYRETSESHNWGNWRGTYAEILRWFVAP